jgi:hypothetical protein
MALMTMLAAAVAAQAAAPAQAPVDISDPRNLVQYLQGRGFRAELDLSEETPSIQSGAAGWRFYIYLQGCKEKKNCRDLLLQASWDTKDGEGPPIDKLNDYNRDNRFARVYLDKEKDPVIEMDVIFTDGRMDAKMLEEHLDLWSESLGRFATDIKAY